MERLHKPFLYLTAFLAASSFDLPRWKGARMKTRTCLVVALATILTVLAQTAAYAEKRTFVFNGEANRLNVYDASNGHKTTLIHSADDGDQGDSREVRDLNAQICFRDYGGKTYFIAGEDTFQEDQGGAKGNAGWGWFKLGWLNPSGNTLDTLTTDQKGKLVPKYQAEWNENYGCGFLDDGRLLLSDVGDQQFQGESNGQLHIWFPDSAGGFGNEYVETTDTDGNEVPGKSTIDYCLVDDNLATAGGIAVAGANSALVASARPGLADLNSDLWGVFRYDNLPSSIEDCTDPDANGVRHAQGVKKSLFIFDPVNAPTPNAIVASGHGTWYVSSVFNGVIAEYSDLGIFMRRILAPPPGELLPPFATGTPLGLGVTPDGRIWYADIGVVVDPTDFDNIGPGNKNGTLRYIAPSPNKYGVPLTQLPPETVDTALDFPDGIGVLVIDVP